MKIVGFLSNKLTLRGTEIALYDYADFNETILGNKSIVISRPYEYVQYENDSNPEAYEKIRSRFPLEYYITPADIDEIVIKNGITHLYIIEYGIPSSTLSSKCKNLVHCVFETRYPHGDVYAAISTHLNTLKGTSIPVVPHMIRVADTQDNLRAQMGIPENAIVFGRYGGDTTFDIDFAKSTVERVVNARNDVWFIFMNTTPFCQHPRVRFLMGTTNMILKRMFINTTDALLHARAQGETFGLTCGEFAVCLKPVITYGRSPELNHIDILKEKAIVYNDAPELHKILMEFEKGKYDMSGNGYLEYSPENVMRIFDQVFLQ